MHARHLKRSRSLLLSLGLCGSLCLAGFGRADGPPPPPRLAQANAPAPIHAQPPPEAQGAFGAVGEHAYDEMEADAKRLAAGVSMPVDRRDLAFSRLRNALAHGKIAAFARDAAINGIFAYQMGEGGFLVKVKKGKGLAHVLGQPHDIPLQLKSVTFGAQIGGGSEWGFGVILGLRSQGAFGGEYKGNDRGATAAEESINITKLNKKGVGLTEESYHEIYMVGVASGLSAGAAIGNLTITPVG